ncbi:MAG: hypothetical protein HWE13_13750 [Gammaproteobacteria bacterium]|nr:hypothetical protein [Gammaproteobacteria bacterium]NVK89194.1 hypothetical protein [Gammaproteobacteria bacterium]
MRFTILAVILLAAVAVKADAYLKGTYYLNCANCYTSTDFITKARQHFEQNLPYDPNAAHLLPTRYVLVDLERGKMQTVAARWRSESGPFGAPSRVTADVRLTLNSPQDENDLDAYFTGANWLTLTFEYDYYLGSSRSITGYWNKVYLENIYPRWAYDSAYALTISQVLNDELRSMNLNPFHFIEGPLAVEVLTSDGYFINLIQQPITKGEAKWNFFHAQSRFSYFDKSGNLLTLINYNPAQSFCFTTKFEEICRSIDSQNRPYGDIFVRYQFNANDSCERDGCGPPTNGCPVGDRGCKPKTGSNQ